jgi:hypothetical protein
MNRIEANSAHGFANMAVLMLSAILLEALLPQSEEPFGGCPA